ncbi:MAG: 1-acyl-sn-glycerol-3-phosphate acyltransferase [Actinomycetota bacterium]
MRGPPPLIVRRLVLAPLVVALSLVLIAVSPVLFLAAALVDLILARRLRAVRIVGFGIVYLAYEVAGLLGMFGLWIAARAGSRIRAPEVQAAHYRFMRWWLKAVSKAAARLIRLEIHIEERPVPRPGPILVFSRHAGPGNSLMLVGSLMVAFSRRPRIVMLAKLQWEPLIDVMANRLPNRFIHHDPARRELHVQAIAELAGGLGERDAFVLFPEGHDFSRRLRERAIAHLRRRGHHREAERAEAMPHVLPPRSGGVMAAITSAPEADVVFVAHTALEDVGSFREVWGRIPLERPIYARYWRIPASEVPRAEDELREWLFAWWARIDGWIQDRLARAEVPMAPSP